MADRAAREPVEQLVELARSAREDSLPQVLEAVANAVIETTTFRSLALNVYRPAWDDYEVVLVRGSEELDRTLRGTRMTALEFKRLIGAQRPRLPGTFFLDAASTGWSEVEHVYTPDIPHAADPGAWQAEDGVIVTLIDALGTPLGFVSADEPRHGRRPTDDELRLLRAICSHAEQALESARLHEATATAAQRTEQMLGTSRLIAGCTSEAQLSEVVADAITGHLGFERVAVYARRQSGTLGLTLTRGWQSRDWLTPRLSADDLDRLLTPDRELGASWLLAGHDLFPTITSTDARSGRNGRGAKGWQDQCLLVPVRDGTGEWQGAILIEDPVDHQLPSDHVRNLVRLLADQASTAWTSVRMRQIQLRLLDVSLVRKGPQALAETLSATISAPVALLDWSGEPIGRASYGKRDVEIPALSAVEPSPPPPEGTGALVRPLALGDHTEGYVVVERSVHVDPIREMAIEQAVTSFSLQLAMLINAEEVEHRIRGTLIDELLDAPNIGADALARRAQRLGHDLTALTLAIAVAPAMARDTGSRHSEFTYLARAVRTATDAMGCPALIAPRGSTLLALLAPAPAIAPRDLAARLIDEAERRTGMRISVGISRATPTTAGLAGAIREAQNALQAAGTLPHLGAVALADELPLRHLLLATPRTDELRRAAARLLAPLAEDDARPSNADLIATLVAYLAAIGNLQATSHTLGIHINTLRYRIDRIERLLGVTLRDAHTRIELQLAHEILSSPAEST